MKSKMNIAIMVSKTVEISHNDDETAIDAYNDPDFRCELEPDLKELNDWLKPLANAGWEIEDYDQTVIESDE